MTNETADAIVLGDKTTLISTLSCTVEEGEAFGIGFSSLNKPIRKHEKIPEPKLLIQFLLLSTTVESLDVLIKALNISRGEMIEYNKKQQINPPKEKL